MRPTVVPVPPAITLAGIVAIILSRCWPPSPPAPPVDAGTPDVAIDDAAPPCSAFCGDELGLAPPPLSKLCPSSSAIYGALVACACQGPCASACNPSDGDPPPALDCLAEAIKTLGTLTADCKSCRPLAGGCASLFTLCAGDQGGPLPDGGLGDAGLPCACPPGLPLCPGAATLPAPNGVACPAPLDAPAAQCAMAGDVCQPCCDSAHGCSVAGLCLVTKISGEVCTAGWECCSGSCSPAGKCDVPDASGGNCGVVLSTGAGP